MLPSNEGFLANNTAVAQIVNGLIHDPKFSAKCGLPHTAHDPQSFTGGSGELAVIDGHMAKPYTRAQLRELLAAWLSLETTDPRP